MASEAFRKMMAEALGISEGERKALDAGSDHPYSCKCDKCKAWWKLMGPENVEESESPNYEPQYGPFTKEEIEL